MSSDNCYFCNLPLTFNINKSQATCFKCKTENHFNYPHFQGLYSIYLDICYNNYYYIVRWNLMNNSTIIYFDINGECIQYSNINTITPTNINKKLQTLLTFK